MTHIYNPSRHEPEKQRISEKKRGKIMNERRWQSVHVGVSDKVLKSDFDFLNNGVVIRSSAQGIPLMTTTGIYGPIDKHQTVELTQGIGAVVKVLSDKPKNKEPLLNELKHLREKAKAPTKGHSVTVQAKWVSGEDGGDLPSVGSSANVFGATGSLLVNESDIDFPVLTIHDPAFHKTLAYYGAKLLKPKEPFYMGFDKPLFGMEYDTRLPGYIQDYVMDPYGGDGLFVEHHPFPHIWFPNPSGTEKETNICRILLGRIIESSKGKASDKKHNKEENKCPDRQGDPLRPKYHFTVFRIPSDGHALAVDECCIHDDSFCNGKQVVFLADTEANTVALRETAPFKKLRISEKENPY